MGPGEQELPRARAQVRRRSRRGEREVWQSQPAFSDLTSHLILSSVRAWTVLAELRGQRHRRDGPAGRPVANNALLGLFVLREHTDRPTATDSGKSGRHGQPESIHEWQLLAIRGSDRQRQCGAVHRRVFSRKQRTEQFVARRVAVQPRLAGRSMMTARGPRCLDCTVLCRPGQPTCIACDV